MPPSLQTQPTKYGPETYKYSFNYKVNSSILDKPEVKPGISFPKFQPAYQTLVIPAELDRGKLTKSQLEALELLEKRGKVIPVKYFDGFAVIG